MSSKKPWIEDADIPDYIECEGFGYFFSSYTGADSFVNPETRELVTKFQQAWADLESHIDEVCNDE